METQQEISFELNQEKVGKVFKTLIDKKEAGRYLGRTEFDSVEVDNEVVIHSAKKLPVGEFYNVKITKAYDYDLEGEVVGWAFNWSRCGRYNAWLYTAALSLSLGYGVDTSSNTKYRNTDDTDWTDFIDLNLVKR